MLNLNKIRQDVTLLHENTDARMKGLEKVCSKGCSACCHQHIRIVGQEELVIEDYVRGKMPSTEQTQVREKLISWFEYFDRNTPNGVVLDEAILQKFERLQATERYPCVFLINGACSIYEARPTVCRTHIEAKTSEHCIADPHRISEPNSREIGRDALMSFRSVDGPFMIRPIAYAMAELFKIRRKLKPMAVAIGFPHGY